MKKSAFGLLISSAMILAACAQQKPGGNPVTYYPKPIDQYGAFIQHKEITLFDLGRNISHNAVDIFDPALTTIETPPDAPKVASSLASFPEHPFMLIQDEDVTVFSLFSTDVPSDEISPTTINPDVGVPPVPLTIDESQLPP